MRNHDVGNGGESESAAAHVGATRTLGPPTGADRRLGTKLSAALCAFEEAREIAGGYALGYRRTDKWRKHVREISAYFERGLPVYGVEVTEDVAADRIWLRLTGPEAAAGFLDDLVAVGRAGDGARRQRKHASLGARVASRSRLLIRRMTSRIRVSPDYLIVGAARCGTTSLHRHLVTHPAVFPALRKEAYFFDHAYQKGLGYYRSFFPTRFEKRRVERAGGQFRTGEATPCYLFHPHVPRRVAADLPGVKLIVQLRNPVDRAYSEYCQKLRMRYEDCSFEEALDREPDRVKGELAKMLQDDTYFSYGRWHFSYTGRGLYVEQLERWFEVFPREQILVLSSEEFFTAPAAAYQKLMSHLDLPAWMPDTHDKTNTLPYSKMSSETRERLVDYFAPHNRRLFELIGEEFDWNR